MPIGGDQILYKRVDIAAQAFTAGTRVEIAHGLGFKPSINAILIQALDADDDTDDAQAFAVTATSRTTVTIKPTRTKTSSGNIFILLTKDVGGLNNLNG